jgi:putative aldouronate transport system substrate-binding protein
VELPGYMSMFNVNSYDDVVACQYAEEITGVDIEYTIVNSETLSTQYSLMIVSGLKTDLIAGGSQQYTSTAAMIEDGAAIDLMEYQDLLPNYFKALEYYPEYKSSAISEDGQMPEVITISDDYKVSAGLQTRADWLEKLGMDVPTTIDEVHEALLAFKSEFGADHALLLTGSTQISGSAIVGAMGSVGFESDTSSNMFVVDGEVKNGFLVDGYKEYLEMLAQWFSEGLIAADFATESNDPFTSNADKYIQGGNTGIWSSQSDNLDSNTLSGQSLDPDYQIVAMAQPVVNEGDVFHFGEDSVGSNAMGKSIAISDSCEDIELACAYLDFWFTKEGQVLANYGVEGVSFEYNDEGEPEYTDAVLNNPEFPMISFAQTYYTAACVATLSDYDRVFSAYSEANLAAMDLWTSTQDSLYTMPSNVELTYDENNDYSDKWSDISTYASSEVFKFVMGDNNFDSDWDAFINQLMEMGLQDCIDIYQGAYDRYVAAYGA